MTLSLLVGLALVVAAILIGTFQTQLNSASHKETAAVSPIKIPTRRDGVLFFSDGAKGVARESALELAKQGYHVLVGVKSEDEKRSFAFESRKGLEIILYDIADPSTLANLVYRLRQIKRDLDRPTVGVILNVADFIEDHLAETMYVDIEVLDINYKNLVKGPVRLMQSMLELVKYQAIEDEERASNRITNQANMITSGSSSTINSTNTAATSGASRNKTSNILNAQGLRVITLASIIPPSSPIVCGSKCAIQDSLLSLLDSFRRDDTTVNNISISTVQTIYRPPVVALEPNSTRMKGPSIKNQRYRRGGTQGKKEKVYEQQLLSARYKAIQQYVAGKMSHNKVAKNKDATQATSNSDHFDAIGEDKDTSKVSFGTRAILHAMLSPYPLNDYEEGEEK